MRGQTQEVMLSGGGVWLESMCPCTPEGFSCVFVLQHSSLDQSCWTLAPPPLAKKSISAVTSAAWSGPIR